MRRNYAQAAYRCPAAGPLRTFLCMAMVAALIGCQSAPPRAIAAAHMPPAPPRAAEATSPAAAQDGSDGSYDWHGLLIAPFDTVLKAVPLTLHEVLLFREEAHGSASENPAAGAPPTGAASTGAAPPSASECYAADTPGPTFAGRTPDEYVLCFARDRLARIQASVRLPAAEAPRLFAAACAAWLKNTAPASSATEMPADATKAVEMQAAEPSVAACDGRDGAIHFSGRLGDEAERSDIPPTESTMSIVLESISDP